jgi:hypothetical protein
LCKFTKDGRRLVTASETTFWPGNPPGAVIVWNAVSWKRIGIPIAYSLDRSVVEVSADCKWALVRHMGNNIDTFPRLGGDKIELWVSHSVHSSFILNLKQDISIPVEEEEDERVAPIYEVRDHQVVKIVGSKVVNVLYYEHNGSFFIPFKYLRKGDARCKQRWPITEKVSFNGNEVCISLIYSPLPALSPLTISRCPTS